MPCTTEVGGAPLIVGADSLSSLTLITMVAKLPTEVAVGDGECEWIAVGVRRAWLKHVLREGLAEVDGGQADRLTSALSAVWWPGCDRSSRGHPKWRSPFGDRNPAELDRNVWERTVAAAAEAHIRSVTWKVD